MGSKPSGILVGDLERIDELRRLLLDLLEGDGERERNDGERERERVRSDGERERERERRRVGRVRSDDERLAPGDAERLCGTYRAR